VVPLGGVMEVQDRLAVFLSEFARTLVTDFPIQGILDHLVLNIVDLLPVEAAGVSLISPTTHPEFIAGSDESAVRYENLQTTLGEGPCLAAYETDDSISIPDLAADDRFPRFAEKALDEGLAAVFTFPLRNEGRSLGALDLYRTTPGLLDEREMATAQTLADVTTAYLLNARTRAAKTEFVATVSHELRTPMTSISGYVEMLQDDDAGSLTDEQREFVNAIRRNSDRLTALANDLLTLSSMESGTFVHQPAIVDLVEVVAAAKLDLHQQIVHSGLDVTFEVPAEPVLVRGDAQTLESVVSNLVGNAVKFTQAGGRVQCTLQVTAGRACLQVTDNGLGIPEEEQRDLFTRFFRSSTAQQYAIQGSGLGLTIVDAIVKSHDGDISVHSEHLAGSTFTVNLPLAKSNLLGPQPGPATWSPGGPNGPGRYVR
jgi:signal transduction histidine kinase